MLDAVFLATSAVCVTGLSPVDIATTFTPVGQGVLLLLVQLGGVGIVTASLALVMLGGKKLSLADESAIFATIGKLQRATPGALFGYSCLVIVLCEAFGAAALFLQLDATGQLPRTQALWWAIFHSVSAFCNAGFSIVPGGLPAWRDSPLLLSIIDLLVIAGGIGLLSLVNLRYYAFWRRDPRQRGRIALQTKIAVTTSAVLVGVGALVFWVFEQDHTLADASLGQQISWSFFHSIVSRTAGFNVVDNGQMHPASQLFTMVLMFIGGSPGSMAGGIKTVTAAVLLLAAFSALRRTEVFTLFGRRLPLRSVNIALMISLLAAGVVSCGIAALMFTVLHGPSGRLHGQWLGLAFEAVSAFGTVGLSTGVTPLLTPAGKGVIIALMFIGRVAPLMLAVYLARPMKPWHVRPPEEDVALG